MIAVAMGMSSEEPIGHLKWFTGLLEQVGLPPADHIRVLTIPGSALESHARAARIACTQRLRRRRRGTAGPHEPAGVATVPAAPSAFDPGSSAANGAARLGITRARTSATESGPAPVRQARCRAERREWRRRGAHAPPAAARLGSAAHLRRAAARAEPRKVRQGHRRVPPKRPRKRARGGQRLQGNGRDHTVDDGLRLCALRTGIGRRRLRQQSGRADDPHHGLAAGDGDLRLPAPPPDHDRTRGRAVQGVCQGAAPRLRADACVAGRGPAPADPGRRARQSLPPTTSRRGLCACCVRGTTRRKGCRISTLRSMRS